jgi:hypothetical protein
MTVPGDRDAVAYLLEGVVKGAASRGVEITIDQALDAFQAAQAEAAQGWDASGWVDRLVLEKGIEQGVWGRDDRV